MPEDSKAVDEGVDAFCAGLPRNACPYEPGTPERSDWLRGWDEAEEIDFEDAVLRTQSARRG
jgi:ribosome modulation factor